MASKRFSIVEFDDGLEIVPSKWIENGYCRHPGYVSTMKMKNYVTNLEDPKSHWKVFKIKKIYATSNSYERGVAKLEKAEYLSEGFSTTEAEVRHSEDEMLNFTFPDFPSQHPERESTLYNPQTSSSQASSTFSAGFEEKVMRTLSSLALKVNSLFDNQEQILRSIQNLKSKEDSSINMELPKFPLTSQEDLDHIEVSLRDVEFKKALFCELKKIGGYSLNDCIRRLMTTVFTNDLAVSFSFCGFKQKKPFLSLNICNVIMDAVRFHFQSATNSDMAKPISSWLRHAKERIEKKNKKKSSLVPL